MAKQTNAPRARRDERGAALITVVLMSMLILMAGLGLIAVTSNSASLAADATSESQAYYAAEAGAQEVMSVLRGNNAPLSTDANAANNVITFRNAITTSVSNSSTDTFPKGRLSRWLNYSATAANSTSVVPISPNYTAGSGMAFTVEEIKDPDNSDIVIFSTSGKFDNNTATKSFNCASGCSSGTPKLTLTYTPRGSSSVFTTVSGATNIGSFAMSASGTGTYTLSNEKFTLSLAQTGPWSATKNIACTISGSITKTSGGWQSGTKLIVTFPSVAHSVDGVVYTLTFANAPLANLVDSTNVTLSASVTPPEPQRLRIKVAGYGPRNSVKKMQMLVGSSSFDYNATGTITMRSHDDNSTILTMSVGSSAVYQYNGNDNSNGVSLPAITVTGPQDVDFINGLNTSNNNTTSQIKGDPAPAQQIPVSALDKFLQNTDGYDGARATLERMRQSAKSLKTPGCTGAPTACDRYFASGETISNIGLGMTNGLMTFVDGDYTLPPAGGAGLLVVTGTLTMNGNADYKGLILVLGEGHVERKGGGGDTSLLSMAVAHFGSSGGFLAPTFNVSGGGTSTMRYDSEWVKKALRSMGPGVLGISEY
jgi:Tfp pilus assembly protein PilX